MSLLLPTQLVFNIGFYAVVPFLALVMSEDLGLGAAAVGLVLGARTFSQQGMFLLGGVIADRWGPRRSILTGCAIRAAGYFGLAASDSFWPFLLSAVLTGVGGAFFSPAIEGLVGTLDRARTSATTTDSGGQGTPPRNVFAWLVLFGEVGAVAGPLIGLGLLSFGFPVVAVSAGGLFLIVGMALWLLLPHHAGSTGNGADPEPDNSGIRGAFACLEDRRFILFAALFGVNLLAYNQLYFALPLELGRGGAGTLAILFAVASALTIALQLPMSALATRLGPAAALRAGFTCIAAGFAAIVLLGSAGLHLVPGLPVLTGPVALVTLLSLGHMLVGPAGLQQVHRFAGHRPLGAYYGLLASCGGIAVLIGNGLTGVLRDTLGSTSSWVLLILLALVSATLLPRFLPATSVHPGRPARPVLPSVLPSVTDQKVQS
ncbi:MFS transporter [Arthrobacter sp. SX1312]|uniref:MFS transporter n=1 Tax=Arthrobacter sp. SX1312 TaxID=2058896 RepID=UPI0021576A81|nr:MFS transporter [Arthrobacter sp. SX1312]